MDVFTASHWFRLEETASYGILFYLIIILPLRSFESLVKLNNPINNFPFNIHCVKIKSSFDLAYKLWKNANIYKCIELISLVLVIITLDLYHREFITFYNICIFINQSWLINKLSYFIFQNVMTWEHIWSFSKLSLPIKRFPTKINLFSLFYIGI